MWCERSDGLNVTGKDSKTGPRRRSLGDEHFKVGALDAVVFCDLVNIYCIFLYISISIASPRMCFNTDVAQTLKTKNYNTGNVYITL